MASSLAQISFMTYYIKLDIVSCLILPYMLTDAILRDEGDWSLFCIFCASIVVKFVQLILLKF